MSDEIEFSKCFWPCKFDGCSSFFKKKSHLLRHERIHTDDRSYKCDQNGCEKSFRSPSHLKRHKATHATEKLFKCEHDGCLVSCATLWNLKRHVRRTHQGKFECEDCGEAFKKNKAYKDHIFLQHQSSSKFYCQFTGCSQVFTLASKLKRHMKTHTQEYSCSVKNCSEKFNLWSECRQHMATCKLKEMACDICGKVFSQGSNLKAHKKIHLEEREVFQCVYEGCGRFYTKQSNLKAHCQSFHQNIKPFICPKSRCKKSFHFKHLLRRHLECHALQKDEDEPLHKPKRRKRSKHDDLIHGLTGYAPELVRNIPPNEINTYMRQFGEETEPLATCDNEYESYTTTQEEHTPVFSDVPMPESSTVVAKPLPIVVDTEETLTATTSEMELDDIPMRVVLEPLKSFEEAKMILEPPAAKNSSTTSTVTASSKGNSLPSSPAQELCPAVKVARLGEKLKHIVETRRREAHFMESCSMQSMTESDSSDSEGKKHRRMLECN